MNKLQQEILEIIEPHTDKTLSEGCYFKDKANDNSVEIHKIGNAAQIRGEKVVYESDVTDLLKVLGHYDITAVLKCIYEGINCETQPIMDSSSFRIKNGDYFNILKIPNKPLILYTEQENIELLEILNKLKNEH